MADSSTIPLHFRPITFGSMSSADVDFGGTLRDAWPQEKAVRLQNARKAYIHTIRAAFSEDTLTTSFNGYAGMLCELISDVAGKADRKIAFKAVWASVLSPGVRAGLSGRVECKPVKIRSLEEEHIFVLISYALALANIASHLSGHGSSLPEASKIYCAASGVLRYAENTVGMAGANVEAVEMCPDRIRALSDLMLSYAQICVARKALDSGMSESSVLRLALAGKSFIEPFIKGMQSDESIDVDIRKKVVSQRQFLKVKCYWSFAMLKEAEEKLGMAIAAASVAHDSAVELLKLEDSETRRVVQVLADKISLKIDEMTKLNNNIHYQKIETTESLDAALPAPKILVEVKQFAGPATAK